MIRAVLLVLALGGVACVGSPPQSAPAYSASSLGDRAGVRFGAIVVAMPRGSETKNLNVWIAVIVNPTKTVLISQLVDFLDLLRRQEPRSASRVVAAAVSRAGLPQGPLEDLRRELTAMAQGAIDEVASRWEQRDAFSIEAVITSLHLSDG